MGIDPMVAMAVGMKAMTVKEQFSMGVTKMALDRMEQTGQDITEMMESSVSGAVVSLDPSLGSLVDISV